MDDALLQHPVGQRAILATGSAKRRLERTDLTLVDRPRPAAVRIAPRGNGSLDHVPEPLGLGREVGQQIAGIVSGLSFVNAAGREGVRLEPAESRPAHLVLERRGRLGEIDAVAEILALGDR
ncbi:hypothetical protein D3C87_1716980 [compost metagenome]